MTIFKPLLILLIPITTMAILANSSANKTTAVEELISKDADKYTLTKAIVTTFENTYDNNNLIKRSRTYLADGNEGAKEKFVSDIFFFYDARNKLKESKTYDKDPIPDESALSVVNLYSDTLDQTFCFVGYPGDTTMYIRTKKNDKGLVVKDYLSTTLMRDYKGYLKEYTYNDKGMKTLMKQTDLLTNETMLLEYRYETKGDTLVTTTYSDGKPVGGISKTVKKGKTEITLTYYPSTNQLSYIEYKTKDRSLTVSFFNNTKNVITSFLDRFGNKTKTTDETYELKQ